MNWIQELANEWASKVSMDDLLSLGWTLVKVVLIIIATIIIIKISNKAIDRSIGKKRTTTKRIDTMKALIKNVIKYLLWGVALLMILEQFNIPVVSMVAAAGVGGIIIGFGAQSLVQDVISGIFMIFEDQFSVGDIIKIGDDTGCVITVGIRTTQIQKLSGEYVIIPNGTVTTLTNYSKDKVAAIIDVSIAYESDIDTAAKIFQTELDKYCNDKDNLNDQEVLGVVALGASDVVIRGLVKCDQADKLEVQRDMLRNVKLAFDKNNIEIPYSKNVVYLSK